MVLVSAISSRIFSSRIVTNVRISAVAGSDNGNLTFLDLDSHTDSHILGNNCLIIESDYPKRKAEVTFADPTLGTKTKDILSGAFLFTSPYNGRPIILVVHQGIHIPTMDNSLLCPM